jgi:hypothetical protein
MSAGSPDTEHPTGWNSSGNDLLRERCKTLSLLAAFIQNNVGTTFHPTAAAT